MRGLKFSFKCMLCRHRKVCHEELGEVQRLRGIIEELKLENEEYERQIQLVQHERILLQNEVARLNHNNILKKYETPKDVLGKANVLNMINVYIKQVGCRTCMGCGYCHMEDDSTCAEIVYKILEKHFQQVFYNEIENHFKK